MLHFVCYYVIRCNVYCYIKERKRRQEKMRQDDVFHYLMMFTHLDTLLLQLLKERGVLHLLLRLTSHIVDVGLM